MPPAVTPAAVVVVPPAELAEPPDPAAVVALPPEALLSLPHAASATRAVTAAMTGRRRRDRWVMGTLRARVKTSWPRRVLRAVPAQGHPLEHADEERAGGAQEGEDEDRSPQLQSQVERLGLLDGVAQT